MIFASLIETEGAVNVTDTPYPFYDTYNLVICNVLMRTVTRLATTLQLSIPVACVQ